MTDDHPDQLPFIDEHTRMINAPAALVWQELIAGFVELDKPPVRLFVRMVGAEPRTSSGGLPETGSGIPGFTVSKADEVERLELVGRHRFSRYLLTFILEQVDGRTTVRAQSYAEFPGWHGRLYRAAVISSGAHNVVVGGMLRSLAKRTSQVQS